MVRSVRFEVRCVLFIGFRFAPGEPWPGMLSAIVAHVRSFATTRDFSSTLLMVKFAVSRVTRVAERWRDAKDRQLHFTPHSILTVTIPASFGHRARILALRYMDMLYKRSTASVTARTRLSPISKETKSCRRRTNKVESA